MITDMTAVIIILEPKHMKTDSFVLKIGSFTRKCYQTELPSTIYIMKFAACFLEIAGNSIYMLLIIAFMSMNE